MNKNGFQKIGGWLVLILAILACDFPALTSQLPTRVSQPQSLSGIDTVIAYTAAAAQTQTFVVLPSSTLTPTFSPPTATYIPGFVTPTFVTRTPTEPVISVETIDPTLSTNNGGSNTGGSSSNGSTSNKPIHFSGEPWTCIGISKSFPNGGKVKVLTTFAAYWTVMNTGTQTWTNNTIDFVHASGYVNDGKNIQDLVTAVAPGGKLTVKVLFTAPKSPGEYSAIWSLKVGNNPFCRMIIIFDVVK